MGATFAHKCLLGLKHFLQRHNFWFMRPCGFEGEVQNLKVMGNIPPSIDGTFYRVMPDPHVAPSIEDDPVSCLS
jgi:hypothetical protein